MNIIVFQIINYTLSFLMWMIVGRIVVTLITAAKQNIILGLFQKVTDPVYAVVRAILPFADVPPEKQGTMWGAIGGCIPFFSFFIIVFIRLALIIFFTPAPLVK
jgi:uncharacterized protein YggT (Ycf19 family)